MSAAEERNGRLVRPLQSVPLGAAARIVRVDHQEASRLVRLSSLGLVPGTTIRLKQRWPALIVGVGETVLALDCELGSQILVQEEAGR